MQPQTMHYVYVVVLSYYYYALFVNDSGRIVKGYHVNDTLYILHFTSHFQLSGKRRKPLYLSLKATLQVEIQTLES